MLVAVMVTVGVGVTVTVAVSVTDNGDVTVCVAVGVLVGVAVCVGVAIGVGVAAPIPGWVGGGNGVGGLGCAVGVLPAGAVGVATDDVNVARIGCVERMRVAEAEGTGIAATLPNGNNCTPTSGVAKSEVGAGANVGETFTWLALNV